MKMTVSHGVTGCKRDASVDDMIGCDNADCHIEWFHLFVRNIRVSDNDTCSCFITITESLPYQNQ